MILKHSQNESSKGSHFFIYSEIESLYMLTLNKVEIEQYDFHSDYLQENTLQLEIVRLTEQRENYLVALSETIREIFYSRIFTHNDLIIYITVEHKSLKDDLIQRFIKEDKNDYIGFQNVVVDGTSFYFFSNYKKTNLIQIIKGTTDFFKNEFNLDLKIL